MKLTDKQLDLEFAYARQHCYDARCRDMYGVDPSGHIVECARGAGHARRELHHGIPVDHAAGWTHNDTRVRWTA